MTRFCNTIGCLLFMGVTLRLVLAYGSEWEFGRYCMPRTLLGPDGVTYANGREIDPITLGLIRADREEECFLAGLCIIAGIVVVGGASIYLGHRRLIRLQRMGMVLDAATRCRREGKWKEADELLRQYEAMAGIQRRDNRRPHA